MYRLTTCVTIVLQNKKIYLVYTETSMSAWTTRQRTQMSAELREVVNQSLCTYTWVISLENQSLATSTYVLKL